MSKLLALSSLQHHHALTIRYRCVFFSLRHGFSLRLRRHPREIRLFAHTQLRFRRLRRFPVSKLLALSCFIYTITTIIYFLFMMTFEPHRAHIREDTPVISLSLYHSGALLQHPCTQAGWHLSVSSRGVPMMISSYVHRY